MSFLDIAIICENKTFTTSVYCKPTFSGVYKHFDSFLPSTYKFGIYCFFPSTYKFGTHLLIDPFEFALVGLNYTMNSFV